MIKIYHVAGTRGLRAIWTCEELSIPYEVEVVNFDPEYRASPEWRSINPVGKVPAMSDGDLVMFESGAMVQYLVDRYGNGKLQPEIGTADHALYLQWSWFADRHQSRRSRNAHIEEAVYRQSNLFHVHEPDFLWAHAHYREMFRKKVTYR